MGPATIAAAAWLAAALVLIMINSGIGMILPPMGIVTFLTASIAGVSAGMAFRAVMPYAAALKLELLLLVLV